MAEKNTDIRETTYFNYHFTNGTAFLCQSADVNLSLFQESSRHHELFDICIDVSLHGSSLGQHKKGVGAGVVLNRQYLARKCTSRKNSTLLYEVHDQFSCMW